MNPLEQINLSVGGSTFSQWEAIAIRASVKHAAREATIHFVDTVGAPMAQGYFAGSPLITITASGDMVFTGYVDRLGPSIGPQKYLVEVGAYAKGVDVVDSSVDHTKPDYVNSDVLKVAKDQDQFGINFTCDFSPDGFPRWRPNPGHTLFESLVPLCEDEGATMAGQRDGSIKITRAGASAQAQGGYILEGLNIVEGSASFNTSGQHSKVKVHGQAYKGSGAQALQIEAEADNDQITRFRPVHEHHDRDTDRLRIERRATRRRDKEQGEGIRANVKLKGWRDSTGQLWTPGNKVYVKSPSLYLCQYMLIEQALYRQSGRENEGTECTLHLCDPRAHGGQGGGVNQSGDAWGFDGSDAT
jgi:prophage tail gpP-like protein